MTVTVPSVDIYSIFVVDRRHRYRRGVRSLVHHTHRHRRQTER